jgi:aspartyl protease family protein
MKLRVVWLVLGAVVVAGIVFALAHRFPYVLEQREGQLGVVSSLMVIALLASSLLVRPVRWRLAVKSALAWSAIALLLIGGYAYRFELGRLLAPVIGVLLPSSGIATRAGEITYRRGTDGHFHIEAQADGVAVRFLVDTGATAIVLSQADARRIGVDPTRLDFSVEVATANGRALAAPIRLRELAIGDSRFADVAALVGPAGSGTSLLGMAALARFAAVSIRGDTLVLTRH